MPPPGRKVKMIIVNYDITDIFSCYQFISAQGTYNEQNLKKAFTAMKKLDATIFIDTGLNTQNRYRFTDFYSTKNTLELVHITYCGTVQNTDTPILIDYTTALKKELKALKNNEYTKE